MLRSLGLVFSAGAFGGLIAAFALLAAAEFGLLQKMGVSMGGGPMAAVKNDLTKALGMKRSFSPAFIYKYVVWGGIWGVVFIIGPVKRLRWWQETLVAAAFPTAAAWFWFYPQAGLGYFGVRMGDLAPVVILVMCLIWAGIASAALRNMGRG